MNGTNVTGSLTIPDTGGWQAWQTVSQSVTLAAGAQMARLVMETSGATAVGNFDSIEFVSGSTQPSPGGGTIAVPVGGDLQAAIDGAQPGDTILLAAGVVYRGSFVLSAKCRASYITIRSAAPDALLPGSGVRVGPEDAPHLARVQGGFAGLPAFTGRSAELR